MCNGCNGFFYRKTIYRHKKRCVGVSGTTHGSVNFATWTAAESVEVSEEFKAVLLSFRDDEAGKLCRNISQPASKLGGAPVLLKQVKPLISNFIHRL